MPGPFATATAVQPIADGQWSASIHPGWDIAGNANGGYLLAMATRALAGATGRPDPVTVTAHYLSPGQPGSVRVTSTTGPSVDQGTHLHKSTILVLLSSPARSRPSWTGLPFGIPARALIPISCRLVANERTASANSCGV